MLIICRLSISSHSVYRLEGAKFSETPVYLKKTNHPENKKTKNNEQQKTEKMVIYAKDTRTVATAFPP